MVCTLKVTESSVVTVCWGAWRDRKVGTSVLMACVQDIRVAKREIPTWSGQAEFCPNETRKPNETGKQKRGLLKKTT